MQNLTTTTTSSENTSHPNEVLSRKDKLRRWGKALTKSGLWFGAAFLAMAQISTGITAHPIVVRTNSIDTGVYWLDLRPQSLEREQFITFEFQPSTPELRASFTPSRHTKMLLGLPGDTVVADEQGAFKVCKQTTAQAHGLADIGEVQECLNAGRPQEIDSRGRQLFPWLKPGESYRLGPTEYWAYAPNPKSLDSRYNGPVPRERIHGVAKPVWVWGSWQD